MTAEPLAGGCSLSVRDRDRPCAGASGFSGLRSASRVAYRAARGSPGRSYARSTVPRGFAECKRNGDTLMTDPQPQRATVRIRRARPGEGERLREIARVSKGHWGYDSERVEQWAAGLDLSPEALRRKEFYVAEIDGHVVGWSALSARGDVYWIDDLWIDPDWIGRGAGTQMFRHAVARAEGFRAARIEVEAERHAIGFYEKMGARYVRDSEPGVWGRVSPIVALQIADADDRDSKERDADDRRANRRERT
jgi:GNAT superfamily N-acetyltransferase